MVLIYRGVRYDSTSEAENQSQKKGIGSVLSGQEMSGNLNLTESSPSVGSPLEEIAISQLYKTLFVLVVAAIAGIANLM